MRNGAVFRLLWIDDVASEPDGWRAALAPEVELTVLGAGRATAEDVVAAAGDLPYALLGPGRAALPAFELARALSEPRPPTCLVVAGEEVPDSGEVRWPLVAFLPPGPRGDELVGRWRDRGTGRLTVRHLPAGDRFRDRPSRRTVLVVKEELRVWPN